MFYTLKFFTPFFPSQLQILKIAQTSPLLNNSEFSTAPIQLKRISIHAQLWIRRECLSIAWQISLKIGPLIRGHQLGKDVVSCERIWQPCAQTSTYGNLSPCFGLRVEREFLVGTVNKLKGESREWWLRFGKREYGRVEVLGEIFGLNNASLLRSVLSSQKYSFPSKWFFSLKQKRFLLNLKRRCILWRRTSEETRI